MTVKEAIKFLSDFEILSEEDFMTENIYLGDQDYSVINTIKRHPDFNEDFIKCYDLIKDGKIVDSYGGEGKGDNYYKIWYFPSQEVYLKFDGYYNSYDGAQFTGTYEVLPKEKTITVYEYINR
jgi:hypothetical protein